MLVRAFPGGIVSIPRLIRAPSGAFRHGHFLPSSEWRDMKEPNAEARATGGDIIPLPDSKVLAKFPSLNELLMHAAWESGNHKGMRSIWVAFEGSVVRMMVKLAKSKLKCMVSARSFDDVLACWEGLLKTDQVPWQQETEEEEKPAKKKR